MSRQPHNKTMLNSYHESLSFDLNDGDAWLFLYGWQENKLYIY